MSNEPKWTPGPWAKSPHVDPGDGVQVKDERGIPVCRCSIVSIYDGGPIKTTTHKQRNANAHLISAAPELYELLETVLKSIDGGGRIVTFSESDCEEMRAALAKARGEKS